MDRQYRRMFDQALEQLGPEQAQVEALRTQLARRCQDGPTKEVIHMKKRTKLMRNAIIAAAVVAMLTATGAAVALGQRQQAVPIAAILEGDHEPGKWTSESTGVFLLDGRYYFQMTVDSEPIDITGQFSDTVPYVYRREMPADDSTDMFRSAEYMEYVIGSVGDGFYSMMIPFYEYGPNGSVGIRGDGVPALDESPIWWRTYCYDNGMKDRWGDSALPSKEQCYYILALEGMTVDSRTGAVRLSVNGEERDVTAELDGGKPYVFSVAGTERTAVYRDDSLEPTLGDWADTWDGDYNDPNFVQYWAEVDAWEDTTIFVANAHDILVYRDGDEVRCAEFVYRPDGTLRYWLPFNCASSANLGWLEEYAAQHGWELDWLISHVHEEGTQALYDLELQDWPEWLGSYSNQDVFPDREFLWPETDEG